MYCLYWKLLKWLCQKPICSRLQYIVEQEPQKLACLRSTEKLTLSWTVCCNLALFTTHTILPERHSGSISLQLQYLFLLWAAGFKWFVLQGKNLWGKRQYIMLSICRYVFLLPSYIPDFYMGKLKFPQSNCYYRTLYFLWHMLVHIRYVLKTIHKKCS